MKKIVAFLLGVVMMLGLISAVGCGGDAFSGNYKEANEEAITAFSTSVDSAEGGMDTECLKGMKIRGNIDFNMEGTVSNGSFELCGKGSDINDIDVSGNMALVSTSKIPTGITGETTEMKLDIKSDIYSDGKTLYLDLSGNQKLGENSQNVNQKIKMGLDTILDNVGGGMGIDVMPMATTDTTIEETSFAEIINLIKSKTNIDGVTTKFYLDENKSAPKFKTVVTVDYKDELKPKDTTKGTAEIYFAFNSKYILTGVKVALDVKVNADGKENYAKFSFSANAENVNVNVPSKEELKKYLDASLMG